MTARRAPFAAERSLIRAIGGSGSARCDMQVARAAANCESVLHVAELRACGLSQDSIERRARRGWLHRLHEGVYAVGHPNVSLKGRFIAATKASGPNAALSHRAQAAELRIRQWHERDIEVTVPDSARHRIPGIQAHRSSLLTRRDLMVCDGILVTNAEWTVVALAAVLPYDELRSAVREALGLRIVSIRSVLALLDRLGPVRGARNLRHILAHALPTRSELEDVVLDVIVAGGFVLPEVNEPMQLEGRVVIPDFRWPSHKLVVEADGARWHDNALARADDVERQTLLERHGETVLRARWDEATLRPAALQGRFKAAGTPLL